jgi:hypothetical protein
MYEKFSTGLQYRTIVAEAEFLDKIHTRVFRVFLLAIQSHLYSFALRYCKMKKDGGCEWYQSIGL